MAEIKQWCVNAILPAIIDPDSAEFRSMYLAPLCAALKEHIGEVAAHRFITPELPPNVTHAEILRDMAGIPAARFVSAWGLHNFGTKRRPNYKCAHMGRVDVMLSEEAQVGQ